MTINNSLNHATLPELIEALSFDQLNPVCFQAVIDHIMPHTPSRFGRLLLHKLYIDCTCLKENNVDYIRFPDGVKCPNLYQGLQNLLSYYNMLDELSVSYDLLGDEYSKSIMLQVVAYKILGTGYVKLDKNNDEHWHHIEYANRYIIKHEVIPTGFYMSSQEVKLSLCSWQFNNHRLLAYTHPLAISIDYYFEQYAYRKNMTQIYVKEGDIVIEGGGCWGGDSTLYLASLAGPKGQVYSFKFLPFNLAMMHKNLSMNIGVADNVVVMPYALWNTSNDEISFCEGGPGTCVGSEYKSSQTVKTMAIDDLVIERNLSKVDFIKMDIEGAELNALKGAEQTLRKFKPKLAICVYHKKDDLITIPQYISSLNLGYKLYLDHFTIHAEETVLFAI